jgi:hypothetical protein
LNLFTKVFGPIKDLTIAFTLILGSSYVAFTLTNLAYDHFFQQKQANISVCEQTADNKLSSVLSWKELKVSADVPHNLVAERVQFAKQAHQISKAMCK